MLGWSQASQYDEEMAAATAAQESVFARFRDMDAAALMADGKAMETAGRLFRQNCAMCHGSDGRGAKGFPNLADDNWQWGGEHDQIMMTRRCVSRRLSWSRGKRRQWSRGWVR